METPSTTGAGEVHAHLSNQPDKGEQDSGKFNLDEASATARDRAADIGGQAQEKAGELADRARGKAEQLRGRAGEMASQARNRAGELLDRAGDSLEERTGAVTRVQENPLAALGIAFGVGFLLAGSSDGNGSFGKAKHQLKGALMGGISAAISQQIRSALEEQGGLENLVTRFTGGGGQGSQGSGEPASAGVPGA